MEIKSDILKQLTELRQEIHRNPEVSGEEFKTAKRIINYFQELEPDNLVVLAGTGIAFQFDSGKPGPNILIRSELDALPIKEINDDLEYKSKVEGVSHKCGHDGHMVMVAGTAKLISENKPKKGMVTFLFQPAEETGAGAQAVYDDPNFKKIKPDYVFALHNLPGFEKGAIVIKEGCFSAASFGLILKLKGKVSHAAEPERGINPAYAIADILNHSKKIIQTDPEKEDFTLITPIQIKLGEERFGTSAGKATIKFTVRAFANDRIEKVEKELMDFVQERCKSEGIELEVTKKDTFKANLNGDFSSNLIRDIANKHNFELINIQSPFKWSEDFGVFTSKFKGAMFGLGSGMDCPALHNPDYDFPDEITSNGIIMFYGIIEELLASE